MATFTATALAMCRDKQEISIRSIALLHVIGDTEGKDGRTVRAAAAALVIPKPSVTRNADALEEAKLIRRRQDPNDRRSVFLEITAAGTKLLNKMDNGWSK